VVLERRGHGAAEVYLVGMTDCAFVYPPSRVECREGALPRH